MEENTNIVEVIHNLIKDELENYSNILQAELSKKYTEEFESLLREHRRKLVLDISEKIKVEHHFEPMDMATNITIKI